MLWIREYDVFQKERVIGWELLGLYICKDWREGLYMHWRGGEKNVQDTPKSTHT